MEGRRPPRGPDPYAGEKHHVFQAGDFCTDRYAVIKLLAAGGMAEIYEVSDRVRGSFAALKTLQLRHRKNKALTKRADSEAKTLLEIRHMNLVTVYDAGVADDVIFFVMELLQGCTLRELLSAHGPLPVELAIDLTLQLTAGVIALHEIGVIHRDLKPENAFVVRPPRGETTLLLKLLDLGAAKFEHRHHVTTSIQFTIGTVQYLSPEQAAGQTKADVRTDVYALAIGLGLGITGLVVASGKGTDADDELAAIVDGGGRCPDAAGCADVRSSLADQSTFQDVGAAGFIGMGVGLAALTVGLVLFATGDDSPSSTASRNPVLRVAPGPARADVGGSLRLSF